MEFNRVCILFENVEDSPINQPVYRLLDRIAFGGEKEDCRMGQVYKDEKREALSKCHYIKFFPWINSQHLAFVPLSSPLWLLTFRMLKQREC